jgi:hypothetical protein
MDNWEDNLTKEEIEEFEYWKDNYCSFKNCKHIHCAFRKALKKVAKLRSAINDEREWSARVAESHGEEAIAEDIRTIGAG